MYGKKFLFWQSEKIWEINPDRTLTLQQASLVILLDELRLKQLKNAENHR